MYERQCVDCGRTVMTNDDSLIYICNECENSLHRYDEPENETRGMKMVRFELRLAVGNQKPTTIEADSTDALRLALMRGVETLAPGWLKSITEYAPYFNYAMTSGKSAEPWDGLPKALREPRRSVEVLCGFSVPGPDGRFCVLVTQIGYLMREE